MFFCEFLTDASHLVYTSYDFSTDKYEVNLNNVNIVSLREIF